MAAAHELALIVREALTNVLKYSKRSLAVFLYFHFNEEMTVEIHDAGPGFRIEEIKEGAGLRSMQARAQRLKGRLEVVSEERRGTTIRVIVPRGEAVIGEDPASR